MNKLILHIKKPGLFTTVQDRGRYDYLAFGVPASGFMSPTEAHKANWLVGNPDGHPVLEITLQGPTLQLEGKGQIALTGGTLKITLDDLELPMYQTISINGKSRLQLGAVSHGCRSYLAIRGDWKLKSWLGSFSAAPQDTELHTPDSLLKKGSVLEVESRGLLKPRKLTPEAFQGPLRILPGPEYGLMNGQHIHQLLSTRFTLSHQSNRMAYRLNEELNGFHIKQEIISSGVVPGTIQVTANGHLMILMSDAQTTGGYPRIGNIITADLDRAAQLKPGDRVVFELVSLKALHNLNLVGWKKPF